MDIRSKAVRAMIRSMAPSQSVPFIQSFQLPAAEEQALICVDCYDYSIVKTAGIIHLSPDRTKVKRRIALSKIAKALNL